MLCDDATYDDTNGHERQIEKQLPHPIVPFNRVSAHKTIQTTHAHRSGRESEKGGREIGKGRRVVNTAIGGRNAKDGHDDRTHKNSKIVRDQFGEALESGGCEKSNERVQGNVLGWQAEDPRDGKGEHDMIGVSDPESE